MQNPISYRVTSLAEGVVAVDCSTGQVCVSGDYREVYRFITQGTGYALIPRAVWSLRDAVPVLVSVLPEFARKMLTESNRATWEDNGVRYRVYVQRSAHDPDDIKFFSANVRGTYDASFEITIYDLEQFFPDDRDPKTAVEVQVAVDELLDAFTQLGVRNINNLKSPVAVLESSGILDTLYASLPDPARIPAVLQEWSVDIDTVSVWQSAYQVGYFPEVYSYDLSSCYPGIALSLATLDGAEYRHSRNLDYNALYGLVRGTMHIDPNHQYAFCSPLVAAVDDYGNTNPVGSWTGKFTLGQVRFIERRGIGSFDMREGWFVYPKRRYNPFYEIMHSMFRNRSKSPLLSMIIKRVIDGIIGRLGEYRHDEPTAFTNSFYHALIRTGASLQVGSFLMDKGVQKSDLVRVNTDGFYTTRRITGIPRTSGIGEWRSDGVHRLLSLSPRKYRRDDMCDFLLDEVKSDPKGYRYASAGGINLLTLANDQDRIFRSFPTSGRELVTKTYTSVPVCLSGKGLTRK